MHLGHLDPKDRVAYLPRYRLWCQSVRGEIVRPKLHGQGLNHHFAIGRHITGSRQRLKRRFDLFCNLSQYVEIITIYADGNGGRRAGENVAEAMLYGLTDVGRDARHLGQDTSDLPPHLFLVKALADRYVDFGITDGFRMLVALRPAGAARDAFHAIDLEDLPLDGRGHTITGP